MNRKELGRKLVHMSLGTIIGFSFFYLEKELLVTTLVGFIAVGLFTRLLLMKGFKLPFFQFFLDKFGRSGEWGKGAMNFLIGSVMALLFFNQYHAGVSVIILGLSDGLSTLIGVDARNYIYKNKTIQGSTAFFTSSSLILYTYTRNLVTSLIVSFILSLMELIAPVDDNLLIPLAGALMLSI